MVVLGGNEATNKISRAKRWSLGRMRKRVSLFHSAFNAGIQYLLKQVLP